MHEVQKILSSDDLEQKEALFLFNLTDPVETILLKFNLWARYFFPQYFESEDALFHDEMNSDNIRVYIGELDAFINGAFRGAGKDVKTKLFIPFCILNDSSHFRRYFKVLSEDATNSKQSVTDIYNMLINPQVIEMYPSTFEKTGYKREETMSSFTTATGIKVIADTVGTEQRGAIQEEARPDFIWFNDFENRKTLRSAVTTKAIWDNMEEARTGLQKGGGAVYTCNYISELGNVHKLMTEKKSDRKKSNNIPIEDERGNPNWDRYSKRDIQVMRETDDDFEGERMGKPSASKDIYFDRETLDKMEIRQPIKNIAGFKVFRNYDPSHRYGSGHDVAGGVGLDSSASVVIDFDTIPAQVVATFHSNTVLPEAFGDEVNSESNYFGGCIAAIENNKFDQAVLKAKQLDTKLYRSIRGKTTKTIMISQPVYDYGWNTNSLTKSKMFSALKKAVIDGHIALNDEDLIQESKSYSRNDVIDKDEDPRLISSATRHFDLLTACAIAWQMKDHAEVRQLSKIHILTTEQTPNPAI